jgi:hypothetical protein
MRGEAMTPSEFQQELSALNDAFARGDLTEEGYRISVAELEYEFRTEYVSPSEY